VGIHGTKNELDIYFKTVDDSWVSTNEKGVMYSDKPEKMKLYD
jgi:hypothetical protein